MPTKGKTIRDELSRANEITITVTGRKSGSAHSNPVWFVLEGNKLYLLPVKGSDTEWYKNLLTTPLIRVKSGEAEAELNAATMTDSGQVGFVVKKFREKYGAGDVKRYYSKFDVAVVVPLE